MPLYLKLFLGGLLFSLLFIQCENKSGSILPKENKKPPLLNSIKTKDTVKENLPNILPDSLLTQHLIGHCNYKTDTCFTIVPIKVCSRKIYLQKETSAKFIEMHKAALKDSIQLIINSGARNFNVQKHIWEQKWKGKKRLRDGSSAKYISDLKSRSIKILLFTAMPGTSRHHWGTEVDLYHHNGNKYYEKGKGFRQYDWLTKNASKYGFYQVYTNKEKNHRSGYNEEKWHWSYLPIAKQYLKKYNQLISYSDISGFEGDTLAKKIQAIKLYVNGIDSIYR